MIADNATRMTILGRVELALQGDTVPNPDFVSDEQMFQDVVSVCYDGYTAEQYTQAFGCAPADVGMSPCTLDHPKTKEQLEVF